MSAPKKTSNYLKTNLAFLMARKKWSQKQVAEKSGVSQKTISNILNGVHETTIETAEALGRAFGVNGWLMISPYLVRNVENGNSVASLVDNYMLASDEGQQLMLALSEREAKYGGGQR